MVHSLTEVFQQKYMVNNLTRSLYKMFRDRFLDLMVEEFLADVPDDITADALSVLATKRKSIKKWLYWQAYWLQRRNVSDVRNADRVQGSLIQIKAMLHLLEGTSPELEEHPTYGEVKPAADQKLKKSLEGVDKFTKGLKKK